jgi:phosphatidylserine/phosphatidylglycerophosphate/cardiolipin synthase-like enzyme
MTSIARPRSRTALALLSLLLLIGCPNPGPPDDDDSGGPSDDDDDTTGDDDDNLDDDDTPPEPISCERMDFVEVLAVDLFGRLIETASGVPPIEEPGVGAHEIQIAAPDHAPLTLSFSVGGEGVLDSVAVSEGGWLARSTDERPLPGFYDRCTVQTIYVGLDHLWFAGFASSPPMTDNALEFLMNGGEFWEAVADDVSLATETVHWTTWWWESDFELLRPDYHWTLTESERWESAVDTLLTDLSGVTRRVLVSELCGDDCFGLGEWLTSDDILDEHGAAAGDDFEVMLQPNLTSVPLFDPYIPPVISLDFLARLLDRPEFADRDFEGSAGRGIEVPAASYHQKLITVDGQVAYVSGFNTKGTDWDSSEHGVFDERRMDFTSDNDDRIDVLDKQELPDFEPRRDYGVRIEGPLVGDVEKLFVQRWTDARSNQDAYWQNASIPSPATATGPVSGGVEAQLVLTMPEPAPERSVLETLSKAIRQAEDYIFIEDQYWRAPLLNAVLLEELLAKPALQLVVITMPVSSLDGGAYWTVETDQLFRNAVPDQYRTFQLASFDWAWDVGVFYDSVEPYVSDIFIHSKLVIVDDVYLSVGSANKNNRGMLYEAEANVSVLDHSWVSAVRQRVFDNLLGPYWSAQQTGDPVTDFVLFDLAAEDNAYVVNWWLESAELMDDEAEADYWDNLVYVSGFLYPLDLGTDWWFELGPDAF